ncbi:hypothetical protein LPL18_001300 [Halomonas sp. CUBES01]|uniref:Uncharacterized protein n=1 Tax=Vreelandella gomseomensis TaxID=370766 RepID=A0ABU1GCE1_9GAMM|nr:MULTISPECIES: hypothetical protein [Halomonas]MDR5875155.1 hypothetical protein [Halomonas gomseomensis]MEC4765982.1 hypothetical protein [Halomonas sp. CUBES01]
MTMGLMLSMLVLFSAFSAVGVYMAVKTTLATLNADPDDLPPER